MRIALRFATILAGGCALFATAPAFAQAARLHGTVTDAEGNPVAQARVVLDPTDTGNHVVVTTSRKGTYLFGIVRPGNYNVRVEAEGLAILTARGRAVGPDKREAWAVDGRVAPDRPFAVLLADGFEATLDLGLGKVVAISAPSGGGEGALPPEEAVREITRRVEKGDCASALPDLDKVLAASDTLVLAHYLRGYCLGSTEQDGPAVDALARVLELEPGFEGAALLRGQLLRRMGRLDEAEAMFRREIEGTQRPQLKFDALLGLGVILSDAKRDDEALAAFTQLTELAPERPEPYLELASIRMRRGETDAAKAVLDRAAAAGASDPGALINVGISYFNKKDYDKAGAVFRQILGSPNVKPGDEAIARAILGKLLLRDGKNAEAIAEMKRSLALDPAGPLADETRSTISALEK